MGKFATNVMPVIGAAMEGLGGIASFFTQGIQHKHEKALNERSIAAQKEQAEYAYSKELEQWERANLYNAPTQQMERLRNAGLNPAMIYGSGGAKTQAATLPKYQSVKPEYNYAAPVNPMQVLSAYQDFRRTQAEINIMQEKARTARAEADNANGYFTNRRWLLNSRTNISRGKEGIYQEGWRTLPRAGMSVFQLQELAKLDSMETRTRLVDKQIQYYLMNNLGAAAAGLVKTLFSPNKIKYIRGLKGKKFPMGLGGKKTLSPTLPRYNSPGAWQNLPRTTQF